MRSAVAGLMVLVWLMPAVVRADEGVDAEMSKDVLLRALVDELERGKAALELEDLERPYFIEYALTDAVRAAVSAKLGAVTGRNEGRSRSLRTGLRVGSYKLDNTNFGGGSRGFGGGLAGAAMPIEDDYHAIRQAIGWATDREYKGVVETFEKKKAFMATKLIEDKPEDFSHEVPAVHFDERSEPAVDLDRLEALALALSAVFREYPEVQDSMVSIGAAGGNKYLVNTEGTRLRLSGMRYSISVGVTAQADDGMKLSDSLTVHANDLEELPSLNALAERCRKLAARLVEVKHAPTLESYTGPVLFEAEAAAAIFARHFARRFSGGQRNVGSRSNPNDFAKKLGKRILPRFLNVVDDPTQETVAGQVVMGHYEYDGQGVKAQRVTLVEEGRLEALLMSRNPSKEFKQSTGHGRGVYGGRASTGCLIVSSTDGADAASLRRQLLEACEEEDLDFGLRIVALGGGGRSNRGAGAPLVIYKVFPDGREELVRGAQIAQMTLKAFKRLLAAGDEPYVLNTAGRTGGASLVAPAMLFEELDLTKIDQDFDRPPILTTPLAR